ncbi:MAG: PhzF family phenazine biosynthesis protein [Chromatiaceae bacterium]|nr:PhzF family phenazine biosynthesis protein [Chromatiaceae bacterium]MCP5316123.1 PhzF family phenazine biosynthesis protein [Chromatiaceae bacterium]
MTNRFYMVDVFAEHAYAGNQLAVVVCDTPLADDTLQLIAADMNFSETTFVEPDAEADGGYRVRIFTPAREIDFAGHPILGTAWVIRRYLADTLAAQIQLNLAKARIGVRFETDADGEEIVWFRAPPMTLGKTAPADAVAAALGLSPDDIDTTTPVQVVSAGTAAVMVPLRSQAALRRSRLHLDRYATLAADGFPPLLYQYTRETNSPANDLCVRFFFEAHGVREDPATGNGAAFLGAYLLAHAVPPGDMLTLRIEQGHALRRPSLIRLRAQRRDDEQDVQVGGRVVPIVQGALL